MGGAPGAILWSVKALNADGSGFLGSILAAIDFITSQAAAIEVANMSFGFVGSSAALDTAITNSVNSGVVYLAAAGNDAADAASFSPANHPDVITVSAVADFDGLPGGLASPTCRDDQDDTLADFSNFGSLVEVAAPGVCIYSTFLNDGYTTYSGTSMASALVAGVVARYIAESGFNPANRSQVVALRDLIVDGAVPQGSQCGFTGDPDSSPEPLVTVNSSLFGGSGACGAGEPPPPPPPPTENQPPVASFDRSCTDLSPYNFTDTFTDADGTVVSRSWDFGDGSTSNQANPSHTYTAAGSYEVTLTVTDNEGASGITSSTVAVAVAEPEPEPHTMTAAVYPILMSGRNGSITVEVFDANGADISGATVNGQWTFVNKQGKTGIRNRSGTTGGDGTYTFLESLPPGASYIRFCLIDVSKSGYTYVPSPITCAVPLE